MGLDSKTLPVESIVSWAAELLLHGAVRSIATGDVLAQGDLGAGEDARGSEAALVKHGCVEREEMVVWKCNNRQGWRALRLSFRSLPIFAKSGC